MDGRSRDTDTRTDERSRGGSRKSFKRLLVRFAEKTSMQGVPYINSAKLIGARIAWIILLLIALGAMGLHLWYLINQFSDFPYTAKVSFGFGNLRLPEITVCNTNPIHKTRLENYDGAEDLKRLIADIAPERIAPEHFDDQTFFDMYPEYFNFENGQYVFNASALAGVVQEDEDEYEGFDPETYDPEYANWWNEDETEYAEDEYEAAVDNQARLYEVFESLFMELDKNERKDLGHEIEDMLITCSFDGKVCNSSLFNLYQTPRFGNCWTLSNTRFTVQQPGPNAALNLVLFLEANEYISGITQRYGLQLHVHEPGTYPDPFDSGILIPSAMETNIGMRMVKINRIDEPHSKCESGISFKNLYNRTYSRKTCLQFCELTKILELCGCYDDDEEELVFATRTTLPVCTTEAQWNCVHNVSRRFDRKELTCTCLNPCVEVTYSKSLSSRQWPNYGYSKILLKQICDRDFDACQSIKRDSSEYQIYNNFVKLNIYYEDLNFEEIKETADIEIAQFLSDVGGAVGLWIGLSILSLCEVFQLIIEIIDLAVHRGCRAGRRRDRRQDKQDRYRDDDRDYYSSRYDVPDDSNRRGLPPLPGGSSYLPRSQKYPSDYSEERPSRYGDFSNHGYDTRPYSLDNGFDRRERRQ